MGFENAEFYIKRWPQLDGMRFEDVFISFPDAIPCGIKVAAENGKIILNPDDNHVLRDGDEVLVIAEDDDTYAPAPLPEVIFLFFTHLVAFSGPYFHIPNETLKLEIFFFFRILTDLSFFFFTLV